MTHRIAWHRRMEARVAAGVTLLVAAAIAAVLVAATQVVTSRSAAQAEDDLAAARTAFRQLLDTRARSAQTLARLVTTLPVFRAVANAIGDARRARAAAAARAEVERAMAEFCAAQPNGGEGVAGCGKRP